VFLIHVEVQSGHICETNRGKGKASKGLLTTTNSLSCYPAPSKTLSATHKKQKDEAHAL